MTTEYIISEELANKVCAILVNYGENSFANKLCSRPASTAPTPNQHVCPHLEYRNDVGFCHYHDNPIQLNTMPEGTTCEDCQRFRKPECPYPDSNITMNKCKAFLINLKQHDAAIRQQERARVLDLIIKEAQRAREDNRAIGKATIDPEGKQYRRGCAVGNKEIGEFAESLLHTSRGDRP